MARKKKDLPLLEGITITGLAGEGKALTHVDGKVLFVPLRCSWRCLRYPDHKEEEQFHGREDCTYHHPLPERTQPICSHFTICGGCKWQHLPYSLQLQSKEQVVRDALQRIGKIEVGEYLPILGSADTERLSQ